MKENNFWPLYTIGAILIIAILSFVYINHQNNQIKDLEDEIAILKAEKDSLEAEIELRKAIKERYGLTLPMPKGRGFIRSLL